MPPPHFKLFDAFSKDLFILLLLNTVKKRQDESGGIPFTEFQKMDFIPHSKIYRILKRLEEDKILEKKEEHSEVGRPRLLYRLTKKGDEKMKVVRQRLNDVFEIFEKNFPLLLSDGTFENLPVVQDPGALFDEEMKEMPLDQRLEFLLDHENDVVAHLKDIREKIKMMKEKLEYKEEKK